MNEEQIRKYATDFGLKGNYSNQFTDLSKSIVDQYATQENELNNQYNQLYNQYNQNINDTKESAIKSGQGAYQQFAKVTNPYGAQSEQRFKMGLGNSGLAESSMIGANNAYQNSITETTTNRDRIINDLSTKINQAKESKNVNLMKLANERTTSILEQLNKFKLQQTEEERYQEELRQAERQRQASRQSQSTRQGSGGFTGFTENGNKETTTPETEATHAQKLGYYLVKQGQPIRQTDLFQNPIVKDVSLQDKYQIMEALKANNLLIER